MALNSDIHTSDQTILILRLRRGTSRLGMELESRNRIIYAPKVVINPDHLLSEYIERAYAQAKEDDLWLFANPESVTCWFHCLQDHGIDVLSRPCPITCLGQSTESALNLFGLKSDIPMPGFRFKDLEMRLQNKEIHNLYFFTEADDRSDFVKQLPDLCEKLHGIPAYRSIFEGFKINPAPDLVIAPSIKALRVCHGLDFGMDLRSCHLWAMGESIAKVALELGYQQVKVISR